MLKIPKAIALKQNFSSKLPDFGSAWFHWGKKLAGTEDSYSTIDWGVGHAIATLV